MAALTVRNLPDDVHAHLRIRAARAGRSMEAEARAILMAVCLADEVIQPPSVLQSWVDTLYQGNKPSAVTDDLIAERRQESAHE